jgi:stage V sporulation protein AE
MLEQHGGGKRRVILVSDGDDVARQVLEKAASDLGCRCISCSAGNPTYMTGSMLLKQIKIAAHDPVLVMFDDNGARGRGDGERSMYYIATHPDIEVLGAIAVASNTRDVFGAPVVFSLDYHGRIVYHPVDKDGHVLPSKRLRIYGDTVDTLGILKIPIVIGIGDIGKMHAHDHIRNGCPITKKAIQLILERSGFYEQRSTT